MSSDSETPTGSDAEYSSGSDASDAVSDVPEMKEPSRRLSVQGGPVLQPLKAAPTAVPFAPRMHSRQSLHTVNPKFRQGLLRVPIPEEIQFLEYTAVTANTYKEFSDELRTHRSGREIKLVITVNVSNEYADPLRLTLHAIANNFDSLQKEADVHWDEVLVVVMCDGRQRITNSLRKYAEKRLKIFSTKLMVPTDNGKRVHLHLFERDLRLGQLKTKQKDTKSPGEMKELDAEAKGDVFKQSKKLHSKTRLQLLFAVQERPGGRLKCHSWVLGAFCEQLNPDVVILVDAGAQPEPGSIVQMVKKLETSSQLGGVCGKVVPTGFRLSNCIEAAQMFEYVANSTMEKCMESVFGYITTFPTVFWAYRYHAIRGETQERYFDSAHGDMSTMGPVKSNMHLAEDRILAFELITREGHDWLTTYLHTARCKVSLPSTMPELMEQRHRWINGSLFALVYYVWKFPRGCCRSSHSPLRMIAFIAQYLYQGGMLIWGMVMLGFLYFFFSVIYDSALHPFGFWGEVASYLLSIAYFNFMVLELLAALTTKPEKARPLHTASSIAFGIFMYLALLFSAYNVYTGEVSDNVALGGAFIFFSHIVAFIMHGELGTAAATAAQYLFMLPGFINMLSLYAFCNMHDMTTALGGDDDSESKKKDDEDAEAATFAPSLVMEEPPAFFTAEQKKQWKLAQAEKLVREWKLRDRDRSRQEAKVKAMLSAFGAFRSMLLATWLLFNWAFVMIMEDFNLELIFAWTVASGLLLSLGFRMFGSILYQVERAYKWFWWRTCKVRITCTKCSRKDTLRKRRRESDVVAKAFSRVHARRISVVADHFKSAPLVRQARMRRIPDKILREVDRQYKELQEKQKAEAERLSALKARRERRRTVLDKIKSLAHNTKRQQESAALKLRQAQELVRAANDEQRDLLLRKHDMENVVHQLGKNRDAKSKLEAELFGHDVIEVEDSHGTESSSDEESDLDMGELIARAAAGAGGSRVGSSAFLDPDGDSTAYTSAPPAVAAPAIDRGGAEDLLEGLLTEGGLEDDAEYKPTILARPLNVRRPSSQVAGGVLGMPSVSKSISHTSHPDSVHSKGSGGSTPAHGGLKLSTRSSKVILPTKHFPSTRLSDAPGILQDLLDEESDDSYS